MSRKALDGIEPQTCLDDLESFYYTLLYISLRYIDTLSAEERIPHPLAEWEYSTASVSKYGFLSTKFKYTTDPQLGKPFQTLVERLHGVFRNMLVEAAFADDEPPPVHYDEVYDMMLSHVHDAIDDLNRETHDAIAIPCDLSHEKDGNVGNLEGSQSLPSVSRRRPTTPATKTIVRTLAANRARRNQANLQVTD